jgi:hypothetical protein
MILRMYISTSSKITKFTNEKQYNQYEKNLYKLYVCLSTEPYIHNRIL